MLREDEEALNKGLQVGIPGSLYTTTINRNSSLYLEKISGNWVAWREYYVINRRKCVSHKIIVESRDFDYALKKVSEYVKRIRKMQGRW